MPVLQRRDLEQSPLADLHAIASELGLEGFRTKRKDDLIGAILAAQGGEAEPEPEAEAEPEPTPPGDDREPDEVPSDEALEGPPGEREEDVVEEEPEVEEEVSDEEIATGVLDVLANGSGFLRLAPAARRATTCTGRRPRSPPAG